MKDCPKCGLTNPAEAVLCDCGYNFVRQQASQHPSEPSAIGNWFLLLYRLGRFVIGGVFCIGLGMWLLLNPMFRSNPQVLTLGEAVPGIGAIVVGAALLLLSLVLFLRRVREEMDRS